MEQYITLGLIILVFGLISYWAIKILCDKKATDYFNANIKDKLQAMFNGHKSEIIDHLEDLKGLKEFKESKLLILNDLNNKIQNLTFFANFSNKIVINNYDEYTSDPEVSIAIIVIESDVDLEKFNEILLSLNNYIPILIYTKEHLNLSFLEEKLYVPVNSNFTLLERLHTAYAIRKIIKD